jgi:beta-lactamase class A
LTAFIDPCTLIGMPSLEFRTLASAAALALVSGLLGGCAADDGSAPSSRAMTTASAAASPSPSPSASASASALQPAADGKLAALERRYRANVGLYMVDTSTGRTVAYHADRRFAHCSTFKALAAGVLLKRADDKQLDHVITYRSADLVNYSPITTKHVGTGMTLRAIIAAALDYSDNTAANLMLDQLGGPGGLQKALRAMGDSTTRADRMEPALSDATPGDVRDTTTARALAADLRAFVLGDELTGNRRALLTDWLVHNTTGGPYIRSGVPDGWRVGDKTGHGGHGTRNDIAVVWPPEKAPVVIAVLTNRGTGDAASDDALVADATKAGLAALGG